MKPYYQDAACTIYHGDALAVLPSLAPASVSLALTDPPYNGVLEDAWDNQWASDDEFVSWLGVSLAEIDRVTTDNASLYVFASPRLHSRVEAKIAERFHVLGNCVWDKGGERKGVAGTGIDVTALRTYWSSNTERVTFAEKKSPDVRHRAADDAAKDASGYWSACQSTKQRLIGDYLRAEFRRAGVTNRQVAALFPSKSGGLTGCVSNWLLGHNIPTAEQYAAMRVLLESVGGDGFLRREYEDLRREYEDLRREYEDLRREYEDLRRPFFLTPQDQWGDVWRFPVPHDRYHPAQKPEALIAQIVRVSSRVGDLVLDPFMGSGTTLRAAKDLGRRAIGIEREERYCEIAAKRLSQEVLPLVG